MKKLLNRKEALGMIDAIFTSLHFNLISIKDLGIENSKERDYFLTEAWKIDQGRLKKDYEQTVNSLDAIGFKEYYKLIGKFATKYKIGCWKEYNEYEPILVEELNEELRKYDKTEDKLELINSFTVDELQSESFIFDSKVQVLYDILDDFNVGNKKEEGINTVLESFNSSDKASFISKLQTDKNLLNALIDKVNGNEKNQLLTYLYKFLSSADGFGVEEYKLPPKAGFDAKYKKGKVIISTYYYIDRKISRYKYRYIEKNRELNPFTNVTFCYGNDQNEITVPAIVLVKSRGDVVLYDDFYKSNIDWKSLSKEKKRELYTEFVLHYLPKELGTAAVGNPLTFIIMSIVAYVISEAGAVVAVCVSLMGAGFSSLNIIEGCKLISKCAEGYDSISDVNAAKVSAKELAQGIALLGAEVIPMLFGLIKRAIAKGRESSVGKKTEIESPNARQGGLPDHGYFQDSNGRWHRPKDGSKGKGYASNAELEALGLIEPAVAKRPVHTNTDAAPGTPEHKAVRWKDYQANGGELSYEKWSKKYDTAIKNHKAGAKFEADSFQKFKKKYNSAQTQVEVEFTLDNGKKVTLKLDAVGFDDKGKIVIQEYKSSETAGFTENQLDIYHRNRDILITDGVVKNGDGSLKIIPKGTKVTVIRPGDVI